MRIAVGLVELLEFLESRPETPGAFATLGMAADEVTVMMGRLRALSWVAPPTVPCTDAM